VALVDGDPYGLDILSVYKYGSQKMRHEETKLATRRIKWLGLWASELQRSISVSIHQFSRLRPPLFSLGISKEHLLPINKHDEKKVRVEGLLYFKSDCGRITNLSGSGYALPARYPHSWEMEVGFIRFMFLQMLSNSSVPRKEMQYMLHSRRKAEIEILSTKISDEGVKSSLQAASGSEYFISNSTSLEASPITESSSAPTPAPDLQTAPRLVNSPIALVMRYLSTKIAEVITQKIAREAAR
jgi:hypothetical protein